MKLYEVIRFSSEKVKWATEYVKRYTKEIYTKKYRYMPEVLKLDDGRTKYTLCIKAKQVATACKYLMAYFGEEIQNLSSVVADILANDTKANHTEYTVHGDGYTCYVYVGDDAGNIHISLYLDAEASEESNPEETETQTETETTAKASGDLPKTIHFIDDIKGISEMSYQEFEEYSESIIRGNIFYLEHNGYGNEEMDYIDEYAIQAKAEWEKVKKQLRENPDLVLMIDKTNILYVPVVARKGGDDRNG